MANKGHNIIISKIIGGVSCLGLGAKAVGSEEVVSRLESAKKHIVADISSVFVWGLTPKPPQIAPMSEMVLTAASFDAGTRVTDGLTDRQTEFDSARLQAACRAVGRKDLSLAILCRLHGSSTAFRNLQTDS